MKSSFIPPLRSIRTVSLLCRNALLALAPLMFAPPASAFTIYNYCDVDIMIEVKGISYNKTIAPGASVNCGWDQNGCSTGGREAIMTLVVETKNTDDKDWLSQVDLQAGGYAIIDNDFGYYVRTYDYNNSIVDENLYGIKRSNRDVRFLVSADCQINEANGDTAAEAAANEASNVLAESTHAKMIEVWESDFRVRGMLYAGDLTQNAWTYPAESDELQRYLDSFSGTKRFLYDGLGNHDVQVQGGTIKSNPNTVRDEVAGRKRNTAKRRKAADPKPHYSWDWHDIHFIQANLCPMDDPIPGRPDIDPDKSLTFVRNTLEEKVGSSGRPVVLVSHYGFDDFSKGLTGEPEWWREEDRVNFWNTISPYNVIAIFTGHRHLSDSHGTNDWSIPWYRPAGASGGPASIRTFVSGASLNGIFLDVEINGANQVSVKRRHKDSGVLEEYCYSFELPVYVNQAHAAPGYGWSNDAWPTVWEASAAINKSARFPNCDENLIQVYITAGSYPEAVTFNSKALIRGSGGPVIIGQ